MRDMTGSPEDWRSMCPSGRIVRIETGEYVCLDNGLVFGDRIVEYRRDILPPVLRRLHDQGLGSRVGSRRNPYYYMSLRFMDRDRKTIRIFKTLNRYGKMLEAPNTVLDHASDIVRKLIYRRVKLKEEYMVASALAIALRQERNIALREIADKLSLNRNQLMSSIWYVIKELDLKLEPFSSDEYIITIVSRLNIPETVKGEVVKLAKKIHNMVAGRIGGLNIPVIGSVILATELLGYRVSGRDMERLTGRSNTVAYTGYRRVRDALSGLCNNTDLRSCIENDAGSG